MAPEDPAEAAAIRADRYTVFIRSSPISGSHATVPRSVVEVHETGDEGWGQGQGQGQEKSREKTQGQGQGAASPSPVGVLKRGSRTPGQSYQGQRVGSGRVASGSPSQSSRRRSGAGR